MMNSDAKTSRDALDNFYLAPEVCNDKGAKVKSKSATKFVPRLGPWKAWQICSDHLPLQCNSPYPSRFNHCLP